MKNRIVKIIAFCLLPLCGIAQKSGFKIDVKIKSLPNHKLYLAHYYGKGQTVYKTDSVTLNAKGTGVIQRDTSILGGIYMLLDSSSGDFSEFLLDDGDELRVSSSADNFRDDFKVTGSQDNEYFMQYQEYLKVFERAQVMYEAQMSAAKSKSEKDAAIQKSNEKMKELNEYRNKFYEEHPESFLSSIFGAMYEPTVPEGEHYYPDGTVDSAYGYRYYKGHYWDRFPFDDERIAYTPIYHPKLDKYMTKLVIPNPDSVSYEALWLLDTTEHTPELFKYTLWYENAHIWSSKIMGLDAAIIPIAEKYYRDRDNTFWLDDEGYEKMMKKILVMQPSMIGNIGNNLRLKDRSGEVVMLHDIPQDYLMLVFWAPDCSHCRKELPKIDTFFHENKTALKDVQLVAIKAAGDSTLYDTYLDENNLEDGWLHLNDDERQSNMRYYYDVETTPLLVLLNPERRIIAKKFNFEDVLKIVERDQKENKK